MANKRRSTVDRDEAQGQASGTNQAGQRAANQQGASGTAENAGAVRMETGHLPEKKDYTSHEEEPERPLSEQGMEKEE
ncbi:MAG TPA: hypothetical protein VHH36_01550 [Candidatus Thermoplasmatota archaeon]|nr:hypothetical protein [Candidatus Thermoplasmatota archaeon]